MTFSLLTLYIIAVSSMLITPGPVTIYVIRVALNSGLKRAFQTIAGTNLASLVLIAVSALVITGVVAISVESLSILRLFGCLYISKIAIEILRSSNHADPRDPQRIQEIEVVSQKDLS